MAGIDIGPRIGVDGEAQFRKQLSIINQSLKTLDSEGKLLTATFNAETDAEKKNAAQKELLTRKISKQQEAVEKIEEALRDSTKIHGEADERTLRWQRSLYEATATLRNMENELVTMGENVTDVSGTMKDAETSAKGWTDVLKGTLLSSAITSGFKALRDAAKNAAMTVMEYAENGAAYADDILTLSTTTGLSTKTLQEFKYMEDLVDVSLDTMTGSLSKMTKQMGTARDGTGDAAKAWETLKVKVTDGNNNLRDAETVWRETIDALGKVKNATERDTLAMAIFGKSAQDLNPLIQTGAGGLAKLAKEANSTGYVLSGHTLRALGKAQDAMDRMSKRTEGLKNRFASGLAPALEGLANTVDETLASPRVRRGIDDASAAIGSLIGGIGELATKALPSLLSVFGLADTRLRLYTDAELETLERVKESSEALSERKQAFEASATTIEGETKRTENLWKELQTLAGKNGEVTDANKDRVDFILGELNSALGTEYTRNGEIIEQYDTMKNSIAGLIKQRQAEALLSAGSEDYSKNLQEQEAALTRAGLLRDSLENARTEYEKAQVEADALLNDVVPSLTGPSAPRDPVGAAAANKRVAELEAKIQALTEDYEAAQSAAAAYYEATDRYAKAEAETAQGNYAEAVRLLTEEFSAAVDVYGKRKRLSDREREDLKKRLKDQALAVSEYKRNLEAGLSGFSESGLAELEEYLARAKLILDGESLGQWWLDGLEKGLTNRTRLAKIGEAASVTAGSIQFQAKQTLDINSPSGKAEWLADMYGAGLVLGLDNSAEEVRRASRRLSEAMMAGSSRAEGIGTSSWENATRGVLRPSTAGSSTTNNTYSTNMGGITVHVNAPNVQNVEELADLVAVRINDQIIDTRHAGGSWA